MTMERRSVQGDTHLDVYPQRTERGDSSDHGIAAAMPYRCIDRANCRFDLIKTSQGEATSRRRVEPIVFIFR